MKVRIKQLISPARWRGLQGAIKPVRQIVLTNKSIGWYALPKIGLITVLTLHKIARPNGKVRRCLLLATVVELAATLRQAYERYLSGTSFFKVIRENGLRLAINLGVAWLQIGLFALIFWPVALVLSFLTGIIGLVGLIALNFWFLLVGMRATPAGENSQLFEKIKAMQELETAITQLEAQLAISRNREKRLDIRFYLGWAETYLGHRELFAQNWQAAQQYYAAALEFDPTNPAARAMLTLTLARQKNFAQAIANYNELAQAVNNNGIAKKQLILWNRHVNETSSEYEINAGTFQLGALVYALLAQSSNLLNQTEYQNLQQQLLDGVATLPGRSREELQTLLQRKAGKSLGALNVLAAGPYRAPANPLEQLVPLTTLPASNEKSQSAA